MSSHSPPPQPTRAAAAAAAAGRREQPNTGGGRGGEGRDVAMALYLYRDVAALHVEGLEQDLPCTGVRDQRERADGRCVS